MHQPVCHQRVAGPPSGPYAKTARWITAPRHPYNAGSWPQIPRLPFPRRAFWFLNGCHLMSNLRRRLIGSSSIVLATAIWLPAVHLFFQPSLDDFRQTAAVAPRATELASRQLNLWEDPAKRQKEID